jgi:hypothetical protein
MIAAGPGKEGNMLLWILCALLLGLWLATMALSLTFGGLAHLLLVAAIALILFAAKQGRTRI